MKVKVTKADKNFYWYAEHVGETFDVVGKTMNREGCLVVSGRFYLYIDATDYEIVDEAALTLDASGWVSVDARMPEDGEWVIAGLWGGGTWCQDELRFRHDIERWENEDGIMSFVSPTHWMPRLVPPPKPR